MKEDLCKVFKGFMSENNLSFSEVARISGLNKTQVNLVVNHEGKEVSIIRILDALSNLGLKVNFTVEYDK